MEPQELEDKIKSLEADVFDLKGNIQDIHKQQKLLEDQFKATCKMVSGLIEPIKQFDETLKQAVKIMESKRSQ